jgi:type IV pilus assembly protein PilM
MADVFSNILNLFKPKGDSVLGIDAGSSAIKVVQLRRKSGRAVLETYGEVALGPYANADIGRATRLDPQKLAEAINDVLRESNATTKMAGSAIPLSTSLISVIEVPELNEKEMPQVIAIEARKYIPVPMNEVTLDWRIIPKAGRVSPVASQNDSEQKLVSSEPAAANVSSRVEVLLVAIHNEALNRLGDTMRRADVNSSFFELEVFSAMRAVVSDLNRPAAIIDIGASSTKLYVAELGVVRASHIINIGSQDITLALSRALNIGVAEAERLKRSYGFNYNQAGTDLSSVLSSGLAYVFSEATKMIKGYEEKHRRVVAEAIFCGGGANLKGLIDLAKEKLSVPARMANPFQKVETPAFMSRVLAEAGPEFSVAIGVALRRLSETG